MIPLLWINQRYFVRKKQTLQWMWLNGSVFFINEKKTVTNTCQVIEYFGLIIDSVLVKVFLPEDKIQKILEFQ